MSIPTIQPYPMPRREDLPDNHVTWRPEAPRSVLLIHDMQKYFVDPFPQDASPTTELIEHIAQLRHTAIAMSIPVAYTAQPGSMSTAQRGLLADFWGPGMAANSERGIVDLVKPRPGDWILTKWRYSAFHRTDLLTLMRAAGRDQLICCGVYGHVGIQATLVDALSHDIQGFLAADAIADFDHGRHEATLSYVASRCAMVDTTERLIADLVGALPNGEAR